MRNAFNTLADVTWSFQEFLDAARTGKLQSPPDAWLPPTLLASAIYSRTGRGGAWSLDVAGKSPKVLFTRADAVVFTGSFTPEGKEFKTRVDVRKPGDKPAPPAK